MISPNLHPSGPRPMQKHSSSTNPIPINQETNERKKLTIRKISIEDSIDPTSKRFQRPLDVSQFTSPRIAPIPGSNSSSRNGWSFPGILLRSQSGNLLNTTTISSTSTSTSTRTTTGEDEFVNVSRNPSRTVKGPGNSLFLHQGFFDLLGYTKGSLSKKSSPRIHHKKVDLNFKENDWNHLEPSDSSNSTSKLKVDLNKSPIFINPSSSTLARIGSSFGNSFKLVKNLNYLTKESNRVSLDMIGKPEMMRHICHASDVEQAEEILQRWQTEQVGKLPEPGWVTPIKVISRQKAAEAQARGIGEIFSQMEESGLKKGSLKVVNGMPTSDSQSSMKSNLPETLPLTTNLEQITSPKVEEFLELSGIDEDDHPKTIIVHPNRSRPLMDFSEPSSDLSNSRSSSPSSLKNVPEDEAIEERGTRNFIPDLQTVEKAVAAKVFFEQHYYSILKRPRDRDQRKELLETEINRLNLTQAEQNNIRMAWVLSETNYLREIRSRVGMNSFIKLKTIGHGAFGVVSLVKDKTTGELLAMKQLRKSDMLKKGQEGHVRAERDLMSLASSSSKWIVRLLYSFQDLDNLYLVMEYMIGGDMLNLLIEKDKFSERMAKFYIAEMVLAIEEAHRLGYIHRDIKPDNFLFDRDGHLKISDFGLATDFHWAHDGAYYDHQRLVLLHKHGIDLEDGLPEIRKHDQAYFVRDIFGNESDVHDAQTPTSYSDRVLTIRDRNRKKLAFSVVGTNNYMAPEVLKSTGYDEACDWWSMGVILFEMLFGYAPFMARSRQITRTKIIQWRSNLQIPNEPYVSNEAKDLIKNLICDRNDRLGSRGIPISSIHPSRPTSFYNSISKQVQDGRTTSNYSGPSRAMKDGANQIRAHPWFKDIDFDTIHLQTPPFVPEVSDETDTKYFEDEIDDHPIEVIGLKVGEGHEIETKDPLLGDKTHGAQLLETRKSHAFVGYTFKGPKRTVFDPRKGVILNEGFMKDEVKVRKDDPDEVKAALELKEDLKTCFDLEGLSKPLNEEKEDDEMKFLRRNKIRNLIVVLVLYEESPRSNG
ncbi:hypothetical protein DFH28DRAFT_936840 [Melampsora americana]|nr:hypothetical protein DFH28DRAFT_936840 [Melampsora americana]